MRELYRVAALFVTAIVIIAATSCNRQKLADKIRNGIAFEGVERVTAQGLDSVVVSCKVRNDTSYRPRLNGAVIDVLNNNRKVATVTLLQPLELPPRATSVVDVAVSVELNNPFEAYALWRRYKQKRYDGITLNLALQGKMSVKSFAVEQHNVPLAAVASTLGL